MLRLLNRIMISKIFLNLVLCICLTQANSTRGSKRASTSPYQSMIINNALRHAPRNAKLIDFRASGPITSERLLASLVDNATTIRENIVGGFDCSGRVYGYYADTKNDCQIFHLCVNLHQLFPDLYNNGEYFQFAFICPKYTIFTQDAMVCAWERSAIPCEVAQDLYHLNNNFFVVPADDVKKVSDSKKRESSE